MTMRLLLVLIIAGFLIVGGGLVALSSWVDYRQSFADAEAVANDLGAVLEEHAARSLDAGDIILGKLAFLVREQGLDALARSPRYWRHLRDLVADYPHIEAIWVLDADGMARLNTASFPVPPVAAAEREYFRAVADGADRTHFGVPVRDEAGNAFLTYSHRISNGDGALLGVAVALIPTAYFAQFYEMVAAGPQSALALARLDGTVVARHPPPRAGETWRLAAPERLQAVLQAGAHGSYVVENGDGRRLVTYAIVPDRPLVVIASFPFAEILDGWYTRLRRNLLLAALALAALGGISFVALRALLREERALVGANEMLERRVAERTAQLERMRRTLEERVADRTRALQEALRTRETLFRELHHRVKNNLQVVSSLLTMQSLRFADPDLQAAFKETAERVQSMGIIHEMLYRRDEAEQVRLDEYLEVLASSLAGSYGAGARGISVKVAADPHTIPLDQAVPIALVVTEALSNAFKHAFPNGRAGTIEVSLRHADGALRLSIVDDGVGMAAARAGGIGVNLVQMLAAQLGADLRYEGRPEGGTLLEIAFPAPS